MFKEEDNTTLEECDEYIINRMREITHKTRMCLNAGDFAIIQAYANLRAAHAVDRLQGE